MFCPGFLSHPWFLTYVYSLLPESHVLIIFSWTLFQYLILGWSLSTPITFLLSSLLWLLMLPFTPTVLAKIINGSQSAKSNGHISFHFLKWYLNTLQSSRPPLLSWYLGLDHVTLLWPSYHLPGYPSSMPSVRDMCKPPIPTFLSPVRISLRSFGSIFRTAYLVSVTCPTDSSNSVHLELNFLSLSHLKLTPAQSYS